MRQPAVFDLSGLELEEPEIAVAIVIEKGGSGSALASSAVSILNAWFGAGDVGSAVLSENTLLP